MAQKRKKPVKKAAAKKTLHPLMYEIIGLIVIGIAIISEKIEKASGSKVVSKIVEAEPFGPTNPLDCMVIALKRTFAYT